MNSGIYAIVNKINGNRYIGSSCNISKRWAVHRHYLRENKHHCPHLQSAWNKYGEISFDFIILYKCPPEDLLFEEQQFLNNNPEYNALLSAGSPLGRKLSEETKAKIRLFRHTDESKNAIRLSKLGKKRGALSENWKENLSKSLKGRKLSDETKDKMSKSQLGNKKSLGHHHSEETKTKMRNKALNRERNELGQYI